MQPFPIALATAFAAALLLAEHFAFWAWSRRIERPWNYVVGVSTLATGWVVWGLTAKGPVTPIDAATSMMLISFGSGAVVLACYGGRALAERAKKNSATVAQAQRLTQDLIDQGERHAARQSNIHDPSRRN